jgi:hypothetical protein
MKKIHVEIIAVSSMKHCRQPEADPPRRCDPLWRAHHAVAAVRKKGATVRKMETFE